MTVFALRVIACRDSARPTTCVPAPRVIEPSASIVPAKGEWVVIVLSPHFAGALLARELPPDGKGEDRIFEFALTYERGVVIAAANTLIARIGPESGPPS